MPTAKPQATSLVRDSFRLGCMKILVATQDQPFTAHYYYWVRNVFRVGRREKYSQPTAGFRYSDAALKEKLATFILCLLSLLFRECAQVLNRWLQVNLERLGGVQWPIGIAKHLAG
jgi:hypothetical protein